MEKFTLSNGVTIPVVGLGTFRSSKEDAYNAVRIALDAGYRHIDTAAIYGNEDAVGKAINASSVKREDIFLTTKVWNSEQGYEKTKAAIEKSLTDLNQDYIDLILVHWFKGYDKLEGTWKALEEAYNAGKVKAIGVSNFNVHHIMKLLSYAIVKPVVNQVETHIELQNQFLQDYCGENGILLEAYAPFMSHHIKDFLSNETMIGLSEKYNKTVPQISLRWMYQRGIIALPKSVTESRIISNVNYFDFELSEEDMGIIRGLNKGNKIFVEMDNVSF